MPKKAYVKNALELIEIANNKILDDYSKFKYDCIDAIKKANEKYLNLNFWDSDWLFTTKETYIKEKLEEFFKYSKNFENLVRNRNHRFEDVYHLNVHDLKERRYFDNQMRLFKNALKDFPNKTALIEDLASKVCRQEKLDKISIEVILQKRLLDINQLNKSFNSIQTILNSPQFEEGCADFADVNSEMLQLKDKKQQIQFLIQSTENIIKKHQTQTK
ncbi:MAG: hypothetical protein R3Y56_06165 [Akkermansia sp.]